ncbi:MAG: uracil-DNA glycosylase [Beijerinckiaceae bacterium]|nr:uracil-DNA glycosylase [Beijerinckiaceae bacterium]
MSNNPNCFGCRHMMVTYDPQRPYGCRAFNFVARRLPALEVRASSGDICRRHEPRARVAQNGRQR